MTRFILFIGFLVGMAYVLTEPPESQTALSANEIPVYDDKPLLTSWGPTLGSLRNGVGGGTRGVATTMLASNETSGTYANHNSSSDDAVKTAALADSAEAPTPAADESGTSQPDRAVKVASLPEPQEVKHTVSAEPAVDRIAAALPPERRGLFSRALAPREVQAPSGAQDVQAAPRNRGLFKRLLGRGKQPTRAWALGPAR